MSRNNLPPTSSLPLVAMIPGYRLQTEREAPGPPGFTTVQSSVPSAHVSHLGVIVPGTLSQPQSAGHRYQAALQDQLPQPAVYAFPRVATPPEALQREPATAEPTPFVLVTPRTVADVDSVLNEALVAFKSRFDGGDWAGAGEVLQTLGNTLTLIKRPPQRYGKSSCERESRGASDMEVAALAKMKNLAPIWSAFFMGTCHFQQGTPYGGPWSAGLRFQATGRKVSIWKVVDQYACKFDVPDLRGEAFKAALTHLSLLAGKWRRTKGDNELTHEKVLSSGLTRFANMLSRVYSGLSDSPVLQTAFLEDLLSAVEPMYCTHLLALELGKLSGLEKFGVRLKTKLDEIGTGICAGLFPYETRHQKGHSDQEARATRAPEMSNSSAMKRRRDSGDEEEFDIDVDQSQQRPRLGSDFAVGHQPPVLRTWNVPVPQPTPEASPTLKMKQSTNFVFHRQPNDNWQLTEVSFHAKTGNNNTSNSNSNSNNNMLRSTQFTMPVAVRSNPVAPAVQFRIPAMPPGSPTSPALALLAQQQSAHVSQTILPLDQASAPNPVGTSAVGFETSMPAEPQTPGDFFDLFNWD